LRKGTYYPKAHGDLEAEQYFIRTGLIKLLLGQSVLKMDVMSLPQTASDEELIEQKRLRDATLDYLQGKKPIPVTVVGKNRKRRNQDRKPSTH